MGGAQLIMKEPESLPMYRFQFGAVRPPTGEIALSEKMQQEQKILNCTASLRPGTFPEEMTSFFLRFSERGFRTRRQSDRPQGDRPPAPEARQDFQLQCRAEQAPNPDSRVTLSATNDAMGVPLADLHWQLTELDQRTVRIFFELVGREFGRTGLGRIQLLDWLIDGDDTTWPAFLSGGFHHMGTTRMHDDPKQGVLDANAQVHGIENLYVTGASAFPTSGAPNPTLTLVALAIRLSDHLKQKVS